MLANTKFEKYLEKNQISYNEGLPMQTVTNDEFLYQRHVRPRIAPQLTFEFTNNPAYLHQYYLLRSNMLSAALDYKVPLEPDEFDKRSQILVLRRGNQVVGGARLTIRKNTQEAPLWIERQGFDLAKQLPELGLDKVSYAEITKMVLLEEFQNGATTLQMYEILNKEYHRQGATYCFATTTHSTLRIHRRSCRALGYSFALLDHINVPNRSDAPGFRHLVVSDGPIATSTLKNTLQSRTAFGESSDEILVH